jgi:hypothetical protein
MPSGLKRSILPSLQTISREFLLFLIKNKGIAILAMPL